MNSKLGTAAVLLVGGVLSLVFVKLMYDMTTNMQRMTDYVGAMSQDVSVMRANMESMTGSIKSMDINIQSMGGAVKKGSETFNNWNPTQILR